MIKANAVWFIGLAVLSIMIIFYTLWKKKDLKLLVLFLGLDALGAFFENVVYLGLNAYEYYPQLLKNPYYDMTLGAFISQYFFVPAISLYYVAFRLTSRWSFIFAAIIAAIELLFLRLDIYKNNWWDTSYTFVGLLLFFWISKKWYNFIIQASSRFIRFITVVCIAYSMNGDLIVIPVFSDHYHFDVDWFNDPTRSSLAVIVLYQTIRACLIAIVCFYRFNWTLQALAPILLLASYLFFIHLHIFTFKFVWDLYYLSVADIVVLICCNYLNKELSKDK
ncbi:hypothetical protein HUB94_17885 [Paenibacillus cellulosilyticus]|nr:hypothetical protein HUB94_17885 [Paenibacillus cellulosilyticus]